MTEAVSAANFWAALEGEPRLITRRSRLLNEIGTAAVEALVRGGLLRYHGLADEFPCDSPTEEGCPRRVVPGRNLAVCGVSPRRCPDVALTRDDVALWALDLERSVAAVKTALGLQGVIESVDAPCVHFVGTTPRTRQDVFLALVAEPNCWRAVVDRLRARTRGQPYGLLVATDARLPRSVLSELQGEGCACLFLHEALAITPDGRFVLTTDLSNWLSSIGGTGAPLADREAFVDVFTDGTWQRGLDRAAYDRWRAREAEFDIFIDELRLGSSKMVESARESEDQIPPAYFAVFRKALECRARFEPDGDQEKDTFSRARKIFDIRYDNKHDWALFPTTVTDGAATYGFRRDARRPVKYALIFQAKSSSGG